MVRTAAKTHKAKTTPVKNKDAEVLVEREIQKLQKQLQERRILCIDGGGVMGTFPIAFLAEIERRIGKPIGEHFDLIVGTSTGGIIALGLGLRIRAEEILNFYLKDAPKIFKHKKSLIRRIFSGESSYSNDQLKKMLRKVLGDRKLGDSKNRLVIPSWDIEDQDLFMYKTFHHEKLTKYHEREALEVALATSAASTYFPEHKTGQDVLIDAGIAISNPTVYSIAEAVRFCGWDISCLRILSLGCTHHKPQKKPVRNQLLKMIDWIRNPIKKMRDLKFLVRTMLYSRSEFSRSIANLVTRHEVDGHKVYRIDPEDKKGRFEIDKTSNLKELARWGKREAEKEFETLQPIFFHRPAAPFQPENLRERA